MSITAIQRDENQKRFAFKSGLIIFGIIASILVFGFMEVWK